MSASTTSGNRHLVPYIKPALPCSIQHTLNVGLIKLTSKTNICFTGGGEGGGHEVQRQNDTWFQRSLPVHQNATQFRKMSAGRRKTVRSNAGSTLFCVNASNATLGCRPSYLRLPHTSPFFGLSIRCHELKCQEPTSTSTA